MIGSRMTPCVMRSMFHIRPQLNRNRSARIKCTQEVRGSRGERLLRNQDDHVIRREERPRLVEPQTGADLEAAEAWLLASLPVVATA